MKDDRTLKQKLADQYRYMKALVPIGFEHLGRWNYSKDGKEYDFSATDLNWIVKHHG